MKRLNSKQFKLLCSTGQLLKGTAERPKIIRSPENHIIKMIYKRQKWLSSTYIRPYAKRFQARSQKLAMKQIIAPRIIQSYQCPAHQCDILIYPEIQGQPLKQCLNQQRLHQLAQFLVELHQKGIFFWDLHLDNIIVTPNNKMGLMDVATAHVSNAPLRLKSRARNLGRLMNIDYDTLTMYKHELNAFFQSYLFASNLDKQSQQKLLALIQAYLQGKGRDCVL